MTPQGREIWDGVRLAVIAVASALVTATLVIGIGETVLRSGDRSEASVSSTDRAAPAVFSADFADR